MGLVDIYQELPLTVSWEHISGHGTGTYGVPANLIDGNNTTMYGSITGSVDNPYITKRIKVRHATASLKSLYFYYSTGPTYASWSKMYIVFEGEIREEIYSQDHSYAGASYSPTVTGPWSNVIGFDFEGYRSYWRSSSQIYFAMAEIVGMGYVWQDKGLYIRTPSVTQSIPLATLDPTHKLRICKGGVVYGIDLLDVSDSFASNVRIYSDGIKALPTF